LKYVDEILSKIVNLLRKDFNETHRYNSITLGSQTQYLPEEDVSGTTYRWKTNDRAFDGLWIRVVHFPSLKQLKHLRCREEYNILVRVIL